MTFEPLAWKYGWEFADACAEQYEAGQEVEEGSDWREDSSESAFDSEFDED